MAAKKRRPSKAAVERRGSKRRPKKAATKSSARSKKAPGRKARKAKGATQRSASTAQDKAYGRRKDYGASVDEYVADLPPTKREIVNTLREIVKDAVPGVVETIRWGMPVFTRKKLICYASTKTDYVRFGFYARVELDDPDKRIAGSLAYVKLNDVEEIERALLHSWIQQVVDHTGA